MEEQKKSKVLVPALIYGAVMGLIGIVLTLIFYFMNMSFEKWVLLVHVVVFIVILVVALVLYKKEYGSGFASFGRLVLMSFLITTISVIISSTFSFVHLSVDEAYFEETRLETDRMTNERFDKMIEKRANKPNFEQMEEGFEAGREKAMEKIDNGEPIYFARQGFFLFIIFGVIVGLIAGAIIKNKINPEELAMDSNVE